MHGRVFNGWSDAPAIYRQLMEPLVFEHAHTQPAPARASGAISLPVAPKVERPDLAVLLEFEESGLLRFALGLVGRRSVAEELVQETFLRLHQVWGEVQNPRGWLHRSRRNLA